MARRDRTMKITIKRKNGRARVSIHATSERDKDALTEAVMSGRLFGQPKKAKGKG